VVIPEFGGFVLHPESAVYESDKHRFSPPHKEIVFNPALIHQDGLLTESYIKMYGLTFNKAQSALKKDVEALHNLLAKKGEIHFEKIGFVRKDNDGKLFFEPDRDSSLLGLKPYGLFPFHLPPVAQKARREKAEVIQMPAGKSKADNVVYMPVNRTFIRAGGVSVAAAVLILFVSTPIKEVDRACYSAGFVPSEMVTNDVYTPDLPMDTMQVSAQEAEVAGKIVVSEEITQPAVAERITQPVVAEKVTQPVVTKEITLPVAAESQQPATNTTIQSSKVYYAIIASFVTEKQANQFIQDIKIAELTAMGIVIGDGRVRVYAGKFDNRKEAENYIYQLRANEKLKDTWLYVGR
jgi:hypothetical protein